MNVFPRAIFGEVELLHEDTHQAAEGEPVELTDTAIVSPRAIHRQAGVSRTYSLPHHFYAFSHCSCRIRTANAAVFVPIFVVY